MSKNLSKHHYSKKELSGSTASELKLEKILLRLQAYAMDNNVINRYDLRLLIAKALTDRIKAIDRLTIYKFIDLLLNAEYITQNPTSHLIYTKKHQYTPLTKPHNDTRYFIQKQEVEEMVQQLIKKRITFEMGKNIPYTANQPLLTQYSSDGMVMSVKKNNSCTGNQEKEKCNNSSENCAEKTIQKVCLSSAKKV